jgi:thiol-disulfide isomerase/thioredoxin
MKKILSLMLLVGSFMVSSAQQRDSNVYVYKGDALPMFEAYSPAGTKVTTDDLKGKYALVVFFATWCPHCQHELPELQEVYAKYGNRTDFKIMPINRMEAREKVSEYFGANGFTMPFYLDPSGDALGKFAKGGIPRSFLVDKNGIVIETLVGYAKDEKTGLSNFMIISKRLEQILR